MVINTIFENVIINCRYTFWYYHFCEPLTAFEEALTQRGDSLG